MLAKLVVSAETRVAAIDRLRAALRRYPVLGIRSNIPFLLRLVNLPAFAAGDLHTGFVDEHHAALFIPPPPPPVALAAAALAGRAVQNSGTAPHEIPDPWAQATAWGR
jgi:3-methylcrotonyl-CoA carboxylase alpha subunit